MLGLERGRWVVSQKRTSIQLFNKDYKMRITRTECKNYEIRTGKHKNNYLDRQLPVIHPVILVCRLAKHVAVKTAQAFLPEVRNCKVDICYSLQYSTLEVNIFQSIFKRIQSSDVDSLAIFFFFFFLSWAQFL